MDTNKISLNTLVLSTIAVILIEIAARFAISQDIFDPLTGLGLARFAQILSLVFISMHKEEGLAGIGSKTVYYPEEDVEVPVTFTGGA